MSDFVDLVGPHEFAHQWWGHQVGWASYHDQWLSEGFAEFSAALVLHATKGAKAYDGFWEKRRKEIFERPARAILTNDAAGPITQGFRIATWQNWAAYSRIIYEKGAYVLHMLRMLMSDPAKPNHDEAFMAMMTDFAKTYAGKNPSTADFQRIVDTHHAGRQDRLLLPAVGVRHRRAEVCDQTEHHRRRRREVPPQWKHHAVRSAGWFRGRHADLSDLRQWSARAPRFNPDRRQPD